MKKLAPIITLTLLFAIFSARGVAAKKFVNRIFIENLPPFDRGEFFGADLLNSLHCQTKRYVIEDELLFKTGDELDYDKLYETIRNLRALKIFTDAEIAIDSVGENYFDVYVSTRDSWSSYPGIVFGSGGGAKEFGGSFDEYNAFGTAAKARIELYKRTENDIGFQAGAYFSQRRFLRTDAAVDFYLRANRFRTERGFSLYDPYYDLSDEYYYGVELKNSFGKDFLYADDGSYELMPSKELSAKAWFSKAWLEGDRVFFTALLGADKAERGRAEFERAFDNTGRFLLGFSSLSRKYYQTSRLNDYKKEDVCAGGWGSAILGEIFPLSDSGQSYYYLAGEAEKSYFVGNLYFFARLAGSSAFSRSRGLYTYEEAAVSTFYRFSSAALSAFRIKQQTVWNWDKLRQLVLDYQSGLRGYPANYESGDNRIIANLEFRYFPDWSFWIFKLSGALFWDCGTAWDQTTEIIKTRWKNSIGFGLRFHNTKDDGENSIFRLDFAFNLEKGKFGEIIFSTDQLFSVFQNSEFKLPKIYGADFD